MTAEITIMNKSAVALAADSAVTLGPPGSEKIYESINKIFTLSKYHPVGVMIYGSAEFMGIPWETLVKMYREQIGKRSQRTIQEYADDFSKFLRQEKFCAVFQQETNASNVFSSLFKEITEEYFSKMQELFLKKKRLPVREANKIMRKRSCQ